MRNTTNYISNGDFLFYGPVSPDLACSGNSGHGLAPCVSWYRWGYWILHCTFYSHNTQNIMTSSPLVVGHPGSNHLCTSLYNCRFRYMSLLFFSSTLLCKKKLAINVASWPHSQSIWSGYFRLTDEIREAEKFNFLSVYYSRLCLISMEYLHRGNFYWPPVNFPHS